MSAHKRSDDFWFPMFGFFFWYLLVGITPSYPECQPSTDAFLRPPACVPKEQTHKSWLLVCVRDCCKRSLEKLKSNKRLRTTLTKNGELFSSTFDLIIYFCVVEFVQIWGAVKAHCQIASSLPFFFVFFCLPPPPKV